jgi:hypothetical protein
MTYQFYYASRVSDSFTTHSVSFYICHVHIILSSLLSSNDSDAAFFSGFYIIQICERCLIVSFFSTKIIHDLLFLL